MNTFIQHIYTTHHTTRIQHEHVYTTRKYNTPLTTRNIQHEKYNTKFNTHTTYHKTRLQSEHFYTTLLYKTSYNTHTTLIKHEQVIQHGNTTHKSDIKRERKLAF